MGKTHGASLAPGRPGLGLWFQVPGSGFCTLLRVHCFPVVPGPALGHFWKWLKNHKLLAPLLLGCRGWECSRLVLLCHLTRSGAECAPAVHRRPPSSLGFSCRPQKAPSFPGVHFEPANPEEASPSAPDHTHSPGEPLCGGLLIKSVLSGEACFYWACTVCGEVGYPHWVAPSHCVTEEGSLCFHSCGLCFEKHQAGIPL